MHFVLRIILFYGETGLILHDWSFKNGYLTRLKTEQQGGHLSNGVSLTNGLS